MTNTQLPKKFTVFTVILVAFTLFNVSAQVDWTPSTKQGIISITGAPQGAFDIDILRDHTEAGLRVFNTRGTGRSLLLFGESNGGKYGYLAHHGQTHNAGVGYTQTIKNSSTALFGSDVNGLAILSAQDIRFVTGGFEDTKLRMTINANGYVGIGTPSPDSKLTISGSTPGNLFSLTATGANAYFKIGLAQDYAWMQSYGPRPLRINDLGNDVIFNTGGGNVGIGTLSPDAKLSVSGSTPGNLFSLTATGADAYFKMGLAQDYAWIQSYGPRPLRINDLGNDVIFNNGGGNVGIGTTSLDAKLTVKGDIHTREVRVDVTGGVGPDYVFEKDYNLTPLSELETYITKNKHLPEVPSAKEMEANGLNLKEMNLLLLKKVEELTLHLIEMKKENEGLRKNDQVQKDQIDDLRQGVTSLMNKKK